MKKHRMASSLALLSLAGALSRPAQGAQTAPEPAAATSSYRGGLVSPPLPKPKFRLTDTSGTPYDFSQKTEGYVTLLFFGYTYCPDMCPLQMHMIAQAMKKLPPETAAQFKVIFVTTDPERDTPARLRAWLDQFDKRFIGLTGSQSAVDAVQTAASLSPAKKSPGNAVSAYEISHAAFVLAYTKDNLAHVIYPVGVQEEDLLHDLPSLVKEKWPK